MFFHYIQVDLIRSLAHSGGTWSWCPGGLWFWPLDLVFVYSQRKGRNTYTSLLDHKMDGRTHRVPRAREWAINQMFLSDPNSFHKLLYSLCSGDISHVQHRFLKAKKNKPASRKAVNVMEIGRIRPQVSYFKASYFQHKCHHNPWSRQVALRYSSKTVQRQFCLLIKEAKGIKISPKY